MILWVGVVALLALQGMKLHKWSFNKHYISKEDTNAVRGIFILLIFASHFWQYVSLSGPLNEVYQWLRSFLGQLVVVPFLFFSGFGVGTSIRRRGSAYIRSMPVCRICKILLQFDLAIMLFILMHAVMGRTFPMKRIILSLVGWNSVGNSDWYVLAILLLYICTWISFHAMENRWIALVGTTVLTIFMCFFLGQYKEEYYYNTIMAYTAGLWYAWCQESVEKTVFANNRAYFYTVGLFAVAFRIFHRHWGKSIVYYELTAITFALLVVFLMAKIKLSNRVLRYCGEHVFSLYILQRIPMIMLKEPMAQSSAAAYFGACLLSTAILSVLFDRVFAALWGALQKRRALI